MNSFIRKGKKREENLIQTKTLNEIIEKTKYKEREVDLLNIDTEGHDFKVLKGLDFDTYKPKLITCEIIVDQKKLWDKTNTDYYSSLEDIIKSDISKYLQKYKYKLISHYYLTSFFISQELQ